MIFVNGSNIFHAIRSRGREINYKKLVQFLLRYGEERSRRILVEKHYYGSQRNPPTERQRGFEYKLREYGWYTHIKTLVTRTSWGSLVYEEDCVKIIKEKEGSFEEEDKKYIDCLKECIKKLSGRVVVRILKEQERGVDVALVTDLLKMGYANAYDEAIVVGAEEDFEEALKEVKQLGKRLVIASFTETISTRTRRLADEFIPLEYHIEEISGEEE
jgi:uncharacterized LabA/DUF88 family protein